MNFVKIGLKFIIFECSIFNSIYKGGIRVEFKVELQTKIRAPQGALFNEKLQLRV